MNHVVPWAELVALVQLHARRAPGAGGGRRFPSRPCCAFTARSRGGTSAIRSRRDDLPGFSETLIPREDGSKSPLHLSKSSPSRALATHRSQSCSGLAMEEELHEPLGRSGTSPCRSRPTATLCAEALPRLASMVRQVRSRCQSVVSGNADAMDFTGLRWTDAQVKTGAGAGLAFGHVQRSPEPKDS
jgi:hypothetical protein